ncbi:MAG: metal-dependent hydrolase [Chloroherpetonaceae bacterium]|nr:metal-dependent hydrolase [Chthonomonadaceae bacterium]MDW8208310.1 metal-dependent hydrolase [Chloroherpetonaceae bacterium]
MTLNRHVELTYLGHATFLIQTPGGRRMLLDPWITGNPACPQNWKSLDLLGRIDLILMTHIHNDHVGDLHNVLSRYPDAAVVGAYEACNWAATKGAKHIFPMNKGGTQAVAGVAITMTHAIHSSSFQEADGTVVYGGEPAGYVLRFENGFTLYAAGDTALFGDMALIRTLYQPELALLPIGDLYTMGPQEAAHAVRLLGVSHVIPIHYGTFPALTGTVEAFRTHTADVANLTIHALAPGETLR